MKKIFAFVTVLGMIFGLAAVPNVSVYAETSGVYEYTVEDGKATITHCDGNISDAVEIPAELDGYPVTAIGERAFEGCYYITSVTIPDGVSVIESRAFWECESLESVSIPSSVQTIGSRAFQYCTLLTNVNIPKGVSIIASNTFEGCESLTSISIPDTVTVIDNGAFSWCYELKNINIPDGVKYIGTRAFCGSAGPEELHIPVGMELGDGALGGCIAMRKIEVAEEHPDYCSVDGVLLSKDKTILLQYPAGKTEETYQIPDSVTQIGIYAFAQCKGLTSMEIPDSVRSMGNSVFAGSTGLKQVTISESMHVIRKSLFEGCTGLESITIPDNVEVIEKSAFTGCKKLACVNYTGTEKDREAMAIGDDNDPLLNAVWKVASEPLPKIAAEYRKDENGKFCLTITIPDGAVQDKAKLFVLGYHEQLLTQLYMSDVNAGETTAQAEIPSENVSEIKIMLWEAEKPVPLAIDKDFTIANEV